MEDIEVPTEHLQEEILHYAQHHKVGAGAQQDGWINLVALTTAILAVFAAVSALLSGHHSNEAMIEQIKAANQWAYYQAKGVKGSVLSSKLELQESLGQTTSIQDREKVQVYKKEQEEISRDAREKEVLSQKHLEHHSLLARAVTLFQIGVAIAAISVLTRRKELFYLSIICGIAGIAFMADGLPPVH